MRAELLLRTRLACRLASCTIASVLCLQLHLTVLVNNGPAASLPVACCSVYQLLWLAEGAAECWLVGSCAVMLLGTMAATGNTSCL
jgi:hypothetical protein